MITSVDDVLAYLDQHIQALGLYGHSRFQAATSTMAFIQAKYSALEMLGDELEEGVQYDALRYSQDVLKYALYGVFTSCPIAGTPGTTLVFGSRHFEAFRTYSLVHDCIQGARHGVMECTISPADRSITFLPSGSGIIDGRRTRRDLDERRKLASRALGSFSEADKGELRAAFSSHFERLVINRKTGSLNYEINQETYNAAQLAVTKQEQFFLPGPMLPDSLDMGEFTTESIREYWKTLSSLALVHDLSFKLLVESGKRMPPMMSVLILELDRLEDSIVRFSTISREAVHAISRDLTYDPAQVGWTEPQYQPLVPIKSGFVAIAPLLVGSNNYERNYSALVEKLPWRKRERALLKSVREQAMIDSLVGPIKELGLGFKPRVNLRDGSTQVGDIDLAVWQSSSKTVVLASLKWHYGPDSVVEVMNHAKRYQEANAQEARILNFATSHAREVLISLSLKDWEPDQVHFLPLIIYQEDMPLEKDRIPDLPAAKLDRFVRILRQKSGNLQDCYNKIRREYISFPGMKLIYTHSDFRLGEWRFRIPISYVDETEDRRHGP